MQTAISQQQIQNTVKLAPFVLNQIKRKVLKGMKLESMENACFIFDYKRDDLGVTVTSKSKGKHKVAIKRADGLFDIENPIKIKISEHGEDLEGILVGGLKNLLKPDEMVLIVYDIDFAKKQSVCTIAYIKDGQPEKIVETVKH